MFPFFFFSFFFFFFCVSKCWYSCYFTPNYFTPDRDSALKAVFFYLDHSSCAVVLLCCEFCVIVVNLNCPVLFHTFRMVMHEGNHCDAWDISRSQTHYSSLQQGRQEKRRAETNNRKQFSINIRLWIYCFSKSKGNTCILALFTFYSMLLLVLDSVITGI